MRTRPWPIIILSWIYFLAPLPNILFAAALQGSGPIAYLKVFAEKGLWLDLAKVFLLFPTAGLAIYLCKRWSYVVYLAICTWTLLSNYDTWVAFPNTFTLPLLLATYVINIGVVSYFLIPAVRAPYFDRRLRWWESLSRYDVAFDAAIGMPSASEQASPCMIVNISRGGVYIRSAALDMAPEDERVLRFKALDLKVEVKCRVAHKTVFNDQSTGYGMEFLGLRKDKDLKTSVDRLIDTLESLGAKRKGSWRDRKRDFTRWLKHLVKSGEGIVPELPRKANAETRGEKRRRPA